MCINPGLIFLLVFKLSNVTSIVRIQLFSERDSETEVTQVIFLAISISETAIVFT